MAIYLPPTPGPLDGIGDTLLQAFLSKQKIDLQKDELKVRQQELKVQQEERDAKKQQELEKQEIARGQAAAILAPLMASLQQGLPVLPTMNGPVPNVAATPQGVQALQQPGVAQQFMQTMNQPGMSPVAQAAAAPKFAEAFAAEKKKRDEEAAFQDMLKIASPLWTPEEKAGMQAWRQGQLAGMPAPVLESIRPKTAMEKAQLAEVNQKVTTAKTQQEADEAATAWLVEKKLLPPGGTMKDAATWVANLHKGEIDFARQRTLELEKIAAQNADKVLEGDALRVAIEMGTTDPKAIAKGLQERLPGAQGGLAMTAAVKASDAIRKMRAPANETQTKLRLAYAPAKAAHQTMIELVGKGVAWEAEMDQAVAAIKLPSWIGSAEQIQQLSRAAGRFAMSPDEKMFFLASLTMLEARLRPLTGAAIVADETQRFFDSLPRGLDDRNTRAAKLAVQEVYLEGLKEAAGIDEPLDGPGIDAARMRLKMLPSYKPNMLPDSLYRHRKK